MMDLRYPIGQFNFDNQLTEEVVGQWIDEIEELPELMKSTVVNLTDEQLDTRYCPDGWSVRQVVHHVVDSHMNTYILFRRAVTEDKPIILPYDEKQWANLADYHMPIENSLILLESLHKRLVYFLRNLTLLDFERKFINIDTNEASVGENIGSYAWHGKQHLAQITSLIERSSW